ncbi:hypothetical protein F5Y13DRAFT_187371 [Hypoxylon sp. FL1857]|nr:hypothetical protein F5Y13DRAFT_187371 [Hypoxylon sp. FL1857]
MIDEDARYRMNIDRAIRKPNEAKQIQVFAPIGRGSGNDDSGNEVTLDLSIIPLRGPKQRHQPRHNQLMVSAMNDGSLGQEQWGQAHHLNHLAETQRYTTAVNDGPICRAKPNIIASDLVKAKLSIAGDHLLAMREDPSYYVASMKDKFEHMSARLLNTNDQTLFTSLTDSSASSV